MKHWGGWDGDVETRRAVEETFNLNYWDSWETSNKNKRLTDRYQDQESVDIAHYQPIVPTRTFRD